MLWYMFHKNMFLLLELEGTLQSVCICLLEFALEGSNTQSQHLMRLHMPLKFEQATNNRKPSPEIEDVQLVWEVAEQYKVNAS